MLGPNAKRSQATAVCPTSASAAPRRGVRRFLLFCSDWGRPACDHLVRSACLLCAGHPRERLETWRSLQWCARWPIHRTHDIRVVGSADSLRRDRRRVPLLLLASEASVVDSCRSVFGRVYAARVFRLAMVPCRFSVDAPHPPRCPDRRRSHDMEGSSFCGGCLDES